MDIYTILTWSASNEAWSCTIGTKHVFFFSWKVLFSVTVILVMAQRYGCQRLLTVHAVDIRPIVPLEMSDNQSVT